MADPTTRRARHNGRGGSSRSGSARSSAVYDDFLSPLPPSQHCLRPSSGSRFSLNELFSSTRREYEFGFDDAASTMDRSTLASEAGWDVDQDDTVLVSAHGSLREKTRRLRPNSLPKRDHYELLCLPKDQLLSAGEIRQAYWRLLQLLEPEKQPARLRSVAVFYFEAVQLAFETLIEPYRRANHDSLSTSSGDSQEDTEVDDDEFGWMAEPERPSPYKDQIKEAYLDLANREIQTGTELGLRLSPWMGKRGKSQSRAAPVDFSLAQSNTFSLTGVRETLDKICKTLSAKLLGSPGTMSCLGVADPTLTVTGAIRGNVHDRQPTGLSIAHQLPYNDIKSPHTLGLGITVRQEIFSTAKGHENSRSTWGKQAPATVIEQDLTVLPRVSGATRVAHSFTVPRLDQPLNAELFVENPIPGSLRKSERPRTGLGLHSRIGNGTAFVVLDSGDWKMSPEPECKELSMLETRTQALRVALLHQVTVVRDYPTIELGYTRGAHDLGLQHGRAFTRHVHRGPDCDLEDDRTGSWTASIGATSENVASYLRYGRDLFSPLSETQKLTFPPGNRSHLQAGVRAEIELGAGVGQGFGNFLAVRLLKRVGRFTKIGAEVSSTATTVYFSLYWSRLGQRLSIPLLLGDLTNLPQKNMLIVAALAPLALFACFERYRLQRKVCVARGQKNMIRTRTKEELQEYIARRRAEADDLTLILAIGAEARQNAEFQRNGLVILSAKYGVKDAPAEEVADVTVAVAALVYHGQLLIPKGLRKSRLLGFWDPAPANTKTLRVNYALKGKEYTIEVVGRQELRIP